MIKELKTKLTINTILSLVLLYPIVMFFFNIFGKNAFFLTSPYFFLVFSILLTLVVLKGKILFFKEFKSVIFLIFIVIYNFTSLRYSLPIFFIFYIFVLHLALTTIKQVAIKTKLLEITFYIYILLSIPFLFLSHGWDVMDRFSGFVGSPVVYAGIMAALFSIVARYWKLKSWKYLMIYFIIFLFVFLSKTRLVLIFMVIFPLIKFLVDHKSWLGVKKIYLIFLTAIFLIYPMYTIVTDWFPSLVSIRYDEGAKDASFALRLYLSDILLNDFEEGTITQKTLGKGNEYSRGFVMKQFKFDIMPHNDFLRLLNDWGIIGFLLFLWFLYLISIKNVYTLYISLVYLLLLYSNMIFNIFLISLIVIFYHDNRQMLLKNE